MTLSGSVNRRSDAQIAAWMIQRVNGVVDVIEPYPALTLARRRGKSVTE